MGGSWQLGLSWELGNRKSIVNGDKGTHRKHHAGTWELGIDGITLYDMHTRMSTGDTRQETRI